MKVFAIVLTGIVLIGPLLSMDLLIFGLNLVFMLIAYACGLKGADWAERIKSSENLAFFIGFLFGLLAYYIYHALNEKTKPV